MLFHSISSAFPDLPHLHPRGWGPPWRRTPDRIDFRHLTKAPGARGATKPRTARSAGTEGESLASRVLVSSSADPCDLSKQVLSLVGVQYQPQHGAERADAAQRQHMRLKQGHLPNPNSRFSAAAPLSHDAMPIRPSPPPQTRAAQMAGACPAHMPKTCLTDDCEGRSSCS